MSDAIEAIIDIVEAIEEYGSSITINIVTKGVYSTTTGDTTDTVTAISTKAIPKNYTSKELENINISANDIKFLIYCSGEIGYKDNIVFSGKKYNILNIDKKILQDTNLLYTIQGRT